VETLNAVTDTVTALALLIDVALRAHAAVWGASRRESSSEDGVS
jgi:hypothetical protein